MLGVYTAPSPAAKPIEKDGGTAKPIGKGGGLRPPPFPMGFGVGGSRPDLKKDDFRPGSIIQQLEVDRY
jgi:hypothetical protein